MGALQRDLAIDLGMANPNYLSMIEKGTHTIPVRRLGDFITVYSLDKLEGLAIIRLTSHDVWYATMEALKLTKNGASTVKKINSETEKLIRKEAKELGLTID
jgi:hypothetical protein